MTEPEKKIIRPTEVGTLRETRQAPEKTRVKSGEPSEGETTVQQ